MGKIGCEWNPKVYIETSCLFMLEVAFPTHLLMDGWVGSSYVYLHWVNEVKLKNLLA